MSIVRSFALIISIGIAAVGLPVALLAALSLPASAEWRDVPSDKQVLDMRVPGMDTWNPGFGMRTAVQK